MVIYKKVPGSISMCLMRARLIQHSNPIVFYFSSDMSSQKCKHKIKQERVAWLLSCWKLSTVQQQHVWSYHTVVASSCKPVSISQSVFSAIKLANAYSTRKKDSFFFILCSFFHISVSLFFSSAAIYVSNSAYPQSNAKGYFRTKIM